MRCRARRAIGVVVVGWGALLATPARADAYDAAMARAVAAKEKAVDANSIAAWQEAERLFEEADAVRSTYESKYELATAAARLREDDVAVQAYESALDLGLTGAPKTKAESFVAARARTLARVDVKGPAGAEVFAGARRRGVLPFSRPLALFAGVVKIRVVVRGASSEASLSLAEGERRAVDLTPTATESSQAESSPRRAAGRASTSSTSPPQTAHDTDDGSGARGLGWTLVVGGGAVAITGTATALAGSSVLSSKRSDLASYCAVPAEGDECRFALPGRTRDAQTTVDDIATWKGVRLAAFIALGVGVVTTGAGVARLLTAPSASAPRRVTSAWVPRLDISPTGWSLGFEGRL